MKYQNIFYKVYSSLFFLLSFQIANAQQWNPPVPLLSSREMSDVAALAYNDTLQSLIILSNPDLKLAVGPFVAAFFEAHEYGHHMKGHVNKKKVIANGNAMLQLLPQSEIEADIYAIEYFFRSNLSVLNAAITYFESNADKGQLDKLPHLLRANLIKRHIAFLEANREKKNNSPICQHKLHQQDYIMCSHYSIDNKPLHPAGDPSICIHIAHPEGDDNLISNSFR